MVLEHGNWGEKEGKEDSLAFLVFVPIMSQIESPKTISCFLKKTTKFPELFVSKPSGSDIPGSNTYAQYFPKYGPNTCE